MRSMLHKVWNWKIGVKGMLIVYAIAMAATALACMYVHSKTIPLP